MPMNVKVIKADYSNSTHKKEIQFLLNEYAADPMGGGKPLNDEVNNNVVNELSKLSYAFSLIGYIDDTPVGLVNCFESFSTFACKPIINIHDFMVLKKHRGRGISQELLTSVEEIAKSKGCCKVTLEVLSKNEAAKASYKKFGFSGYELNSAAGNALFWQKLIIST